MARQPEQPRDGAETPPVTTEAPAEAPLAEALGPMLFPAENWQIDNAEVGDIGYWGDNPQPRYTRDLPEAEREAAEARIAAQVAKVEVPLALAIKQGAPAQEPTPPEEAASVEQEGEQPPKGRGRAASA